jgi:hypothetical protein
MHIVQYRTDLNLTVDLHIFFYSDQTFRKVFLSESRIRPYVQYAGTVLYCVYR